ncbi:MAG: heparinase II/III family protein [Sediminicola sp.]
MMEIKAQEERNFLGDLLLEQPTYQWGNSNFPNFNANDVHNKLTNLSKAKQGEIILNGEKRLDYQWPSIPVTSYLEFTRSGDRKVMENYYNERLNTLKDLVLAELLEDKGRFVDAIANGVWAFCEQSTWVLSAHLPAQKDGAAIPDINDIIIDLGAGEIAASLGWTYHFFKDDFKKNSFLLNERIQHEIKKRIIQPYLMTDDFWWMGFKEHAFVNNWNPWCNYNVVLSTVLLGNAVSIHQKNEVIQKSMRSVDRFINYYNQDGACEEGPNYWSHAGGKMLEYLELLRAISNEKIDVGNRQVIKNMGRYIMQVHIAGDYYVNFADSSVRAYPSCGLIYRYGAYINDTSLKGFAAYIAKTNGFFENPIEETLDRTLNNLQLLEILKGIRPKKENDLFYWFPETEIAIGRTHESPEKGFFFASKGGHNDESHNHNDVGSFILYHAGEPLLVDVGVETYSAKTFSNQRYDIWTMQSDYHNLPQINGYSQAYGQKYRAEETSFYNSGKKMEFQLDIGNSYSNEAKCTDWHRSYILQRNGNQLIITDRYKLQKYRSPSVEHFIMATEPSIVENGKIKLKDVNGKKVFMFYPSKKFTCEIEELPLEDPKLLKAWQQNKLFRLILRSTKESLEDTFTFKIVEE